MSASGDSVDNLRRGRARSATSRLLNRTVRFLARLALARSQTALHLSIFAARRIMAGVPFLRLTGADAEAMRGSFAAEVARRLGRPSSFVAPPVPTLAQPSSAPAPAPSFIKLSTPPIKPEPDAWPPTPPASIQHASPAFQSPPKPAGRPERWTPHDFHRFVNLKAEIEPHWSA